MRLATLIVSGFIMLAAESVESVCGQSSKCLAVITEINGSVLIREFNKPVTRKATWGAQLFQGDQVMTESNSSVSLLFANSSLIKLEENGKITVSANTPSTSQKIGNVPETLSASIGSSFASLVSRRETGEEKGALAGLRSGAGDELINPESPCNTYIKGCKPSFYWSAAKSFDNLRVNLFSSKGLVWSKKAEGLRLDYPENEKALEAGETYFWNVEGEELLNSIKSANHRFSVLQADKSKEVSEQEKLIMETFDGNLQSCSLHSVMGAYYLNQGLLEDAAIEFRIIAGMNTESPLPHEILGSIYSELGKKDKAIEELQKALTLSDNK